MSQYYYEISDDGEEYVNVETLSTDGKIRAPKSTPPVYSIRLDLGDGTIREAGWLTCEWRWGHMPAGMRSALRAYCAGASSSVWIRTLTDTILEEEDDPGDDFLYYSAIMIWPEPEADEPDTRASRLDFVIKFRKLVLIEEEEPPA